MYKKNKQAFTFVELIVVMTILAILSTIGFGVYQSYLSGGRDTNRLVQLKDIHDGLERYSVNSRLPFPEDMTEIQANGNTFAYQGYAGNGIIKAIGYDGGGKDTEYGSYLTYMLGDNQRDFQLMTFVNDADLLSYNPVKSSYASIDYTLLFPKVLGLPLGILVDDSSNAPIQEIDTISGVGKYDIITGTGSLKAYYSDKKFISSNTGDGLGRILGNGSCKRIHELGKSHENGRYIISPDGSSKIEVYCDMETDGGGWTLIARSNGDYAGSDTDFGWLIERGSIDDDSIPYSLGPDSKSLYFDELMWTKYTTGKYIELPIRKTFVSRDTLASETTNSVLSNAGCVDVSGEIDCEQVYWGNIPNAGYPNRYFFSTNDGWFHRGLHIGGFVYNNADSFHAQDGMLFVR